VPPPDDSPDPCKDPKPTGVNRQRVSIRQAFARPTGTIVLPLQASRIIGRCRPQDNGRRPTGCGKGPTSVPSAAGNPVNAHVFGGDSFRSGRIPPKIHKDVTMCGGQDSHECAGRSIRSDTTALSRHQLELMSPPYGRVGCVVRTNTLLAQFLRGSSLSFAGDCTANACSLGEHRCRMMIVCGTHPTTPSTLIGSSRDFGDHRNRRSGTPGVVVQGEFIALRPPA